MTPMYWLFSVTPENWEIVKAENLWAIRSKTVADTINVGDCLIFYVKCSQPPSFMGIYEVAGKWRQSLKPRWSDEVSLGEMIYHWEVDLKPKALGTANIKELASGLSFVENKQKWFIYLQGTPANFKRPIDASDFMIIASTLSGPPYEVKFKPTVTVRAPKAPAKPETLPTPVTWMPALPVPSHTEIRDAILRLGELEEYVVDKDVPLDRELLDVTWRRKVRKVPDIAFEVQKRGNIYQALTKLKEAWDLWRCTSVLVTTQEYETEAKRWLGTAFHEMEKDARIVRWENIKRWLEIMKERKRIKDELRI